MPSDDLNVSPSASIRECVRGLKSWKDLADLGITIERRGDETVYSNLNGYVAIVSPEDVAEGLTRLHGDSVQLGEWAEVVLGGSSFLDLHLEDHGYGAALLEALWEASAGEPIRESAMLAARELYAGN